MRCVDFSMRRRGGGVESLGGKLAVFAGSPSFASASCVDRVMASGEDATTTRMSTKDEHGLNPRQKKFVDLWLEGMAAGPAYTKAGFSANGADQAARNLLRKTQIVAYVESERQRLGEMSALKKWEAVAHLTRVIKTPIGEVDEKSDLAQEFQVSEFGTRIKMMSKMDAFEKLAKMLGWYEPDKVEHTVEVIIGGSAGE
jgi:phage terminase small subunit